MSEQTSILRSSAVMAAGTVVSRASGFVRSALLVAALGAGAHADAFTIANTIPNMLYILLAGGVFNAVLVPQLVRAMKSDADGGDAYTNRIMTLAICFLGAVTLVLVVAAPWVMRIYLGGDWFEPDMADELESAIDFARWCLPQVFFYGLFVLVGQILNARGRFGPMMWAPIANNVISVGVLVAYLVVFGPGDSGGFSTGQEVLLGLGSTLGILAQFLILLPVLRAAGYRFSPRFDVRDSGLGHTLRLAGWTLGFVIVNQLAYTVVVRLASTGSGEGGTGYIAYSNSFLVTQVPHSIITVSLATAMLPSLSRRAADLDLTGLGHTLSGTLRSCLAIIIPIAVVLPVVALPAAKLLFGYGAGADSFDAFAPTMAAFAPGLVFFTVHYLMLRGFYALERNRTVFWIQCLLGTVNVALAVLLVRALAADHTAPALAIAYGCAYLVGALTSYTLLQRRLGTLETGRLIGFLIRIGLASGAGALVAWAGRALWNGVDPDPGYLTSLAQVVVLGLVHLGIVIVLARLLRITELTSMLRQIASRLRH